jgi:ATP:ADP antiporter, AAA family
MSQGFVQTIKSIKGKDRKNLFFVALSLFCVLFSYPITRSTTTSIFLQSHGAKNSPVVWLYSVIGLTVVVFLFNKFQKQLKVHKLFYFVCILSAVIFSLLSWGFFHGSEWMAYPLYIWKEIYIVLLVHLLFGYLMNSMNYQVAKVLYGPIGAMSSLGGVAGGVYTSWATKNFNTLEILIIGIVPIISSGIAFYFTNKEINIVDLEKEEVKTSPLESVWKIKNYVFLIGAVITFSQFFINLANFKFNILFENSVTEQINKTDYLGRLYSTVNLVSFLVQIFLIPVLLRFVKLRVVHHIIPLLYLFVSIGCFGIAAGSMIFVASAFVIFKGVDYSLFSTAKELLYFPLSPSQKYGAKYINDIVIYRFAKGLISLILIKVQWELAVTGMMYISLVIWLVLLIPLFKYENKIQKES